MRTVAKGLAASGQGAEWHLPNDCQALHQPANSSGADQDKCQCAMQSRGWTNLVGACSTAHPDSYIATEWQKVHLDPKAAQQAGKPEDMPPSSTQPLDTPQRACAQGCRRTMAGCVCKRLHDSRQNPALSRSARSQVIAL